MRGGRWMWRGRGCCVVLGDMGAIISRKSYINNNDKNNNKNHHDNNNNNNNKLILLL